MNLRVLGLDPGYGRLGYGVVEQQGNEWRLQTAGIIETKANIPFEERLLQIEEGLSALIRETQPAEAALETLFFSKNVKTAMQVAEARGVIRFTLARMAVPVLELNPGSVKLALAGSGSAGKAQVSRMVVRLLNLKEAPKPDDAADAVALALTALRSAPLRSRLEQLKKGKKNR